MHLTLETYCDRGLNMLAKHVLINKNMFVLITDEKKKMMVLLKVMWF